MKERALIKETSNMLDEKITEILDNMDRQTKQTNLMIKLCWLAVIVLNIAVIWSFLSK